MIELTKERVKEVGFEGKWSGLVADATKAVEAIEEERFDAVMANYLFEYAETKEQLTMMATNLFRGAKKGAALSVLYVPGVHPPEDIDPVRECTGIQCEPLTADTQAGSKVKLTYHNMQDFSYEVFYWPVEMLAETLREVGFADVEVHRLKLDPAYSGSQDLAKFAKHTGNRSLTGRKP
eukprot:TRINITY_DN27378_c0_g1_i1.p1 TRINITY_DN27378_c0_g1~~TRINITY_DN27378_c0_g1_i1.p1  ORF type:complete len:179 (-),score=51.19 TRINITY_DN27378_c0_g1_i1:95-631(-)